MAELPKEWPLVNSAFLLIKLGQRKGDGTMKRKVVIMVMIGLLIFSFFSSPAFAGIEPVPWHAQLNRLNSVMNGLDSINKRLENVLRPPNPCKLRMPAPEGVIGRLEAIANQLEVLNDRTTAAMSGVPMEPLPLEIEIALMGIGDGAEAIVRMTGEGFACPYDNRGVQDALMEVQTGAMMIIETVDSFMPGTAPSLQ